MQQSILYEKLNISIKPIETYVMIFSIKQKLFSCQIPVFHDIVIVLLYYAIMIFYLNQNCKYNIKIAMKCMTQGRESSANFVTPVTSKDLIKKV